MPSLELNPENLAAPEAPKPPVELDEAAQKTIEKPEGQQQLEQEQKEEKNKALNAVPEDKANDDLTMEDIQKMEEKAYVNKEGLFYRLAKAPVIQKFLPDIANGLSVIGNGLSSLSSLFSLDSWLQKKFKKLGEWTTNVFLHVNGFVNAVEQLARNNYLSAIGYLIDNAVAVLVPQDKQFLAHGFAAGSYISAIGLSGLTGRSTFKGFGEHLKYIVEGFKRGFKLLIDDPIKNLTSSETGLLALASGLTIFTGSAIWGLTGNETVGSNIRNIGGVMQDIEQIKPSHLWNKKYNYFISGVGVTLGTFSDWYAKWFPENKGTAVPATFLFDGLGRYFLRKSQMADEQTLTSDKLETPIYNLDSLRKDYEMKQAA